MQNNVTAFIISTSIMFLWVEGMKIVSRIIDLKLWQRRKLLHILTGPIFIMTWSLFTDSFEGAVYAACCPLLMTTKFVLIGLGFIDDVDAVASATRTGDRRELLKGPLYYGCIFIVATLLNWKSVRSVLCMFILCFGDGFAELIGRQFGRHKLPWSKDKSWAGSVAFIMASLVATTGFLLICNRWNVLTPIEARILQEGGTVLLMNRILIVSIGAAIIESFPLQDIDNITVFITAILIDMCQSVPS